ncbi:SMI1/KNR4 family protein [Exiguobacterium sp. KRL4]|uniref:SMI1/KNR4 family protein n=1 Tax=Exiguobacterium sp. KRL4 TaxID=1914536 RepID=UPI0008F904C2|nr:SMI1/KNR4 family protein [Exiguobacterium sp. KRL4]OIN66963.1 SMI1/KNR4 family protein [Exiguobacterium sp. KRL4]
MHQAGMETLLQLQARLINGQLEVQKEEGYVEVESFTFYSGASPKELARLPKDTPKEIVHFLSFHNGARLYFTPDGGGGFELFTIDDILAYLSIWECPTGFIPIGAGPDGEWLVCESISESDNRIWTGEFLTYEDSDFERLPFSFSKWLDYLIVAQGAMYWDWFR